MRPRRLTTVRIFALPAALALVTSAGLAAGLVGDGGWDAAAWLGLALPIAAGWRAMLLRPRA